MKMNYMLRRTLIILLVISVTLILLLTGCGKSSDDLYREGMILIRMKRTFLKGLKSLRKFEKKFPDDSRAPETVFTFALANQSIKNFNESIDAYKRIIDNYPGSDEAYKSKFLIAYLYYDELNDIDRATKIFEEFLEEYPVSELSVSADVILRNIDLPIEEWSIIKQFGLINSPPDDTQDSK